jgi:mannosyltransferase
MASTATAVTLVALGRRLGSAPVGVVAGLLFAVAPLTSRYGQEARPYAVATLAATVAALALARATEPDARRWAWAGYGLAVVATGLANVLALLVLTGHLAFVLSSRRSTPRSWVLATGGALVVLSPFLVATSRQAGQVSWLTRPGTGELGDVLAAPFDGLALPGLLLILALLAAWLRPAWVERSALALGTGWGLLPPVLLWLVSQGHPLFDGRYTVAALPGLCLALASVASHSPPSFSLREQARRAVTGAMIVAVLAVAGWPAQLRYRDPASGHSEDVRGAVRILARQALPGDAVFFVPYHLRIVALMAPALRSLISRN